MIAPLTPDEKGKEIGMQFLRETQIPTVTFQRDKLFRLISEGILQQTAAKDERIKELESELLKVYQDWKVLFDKSLITQEKDARIAELEAKLSYCEKAKSLTAEDCQNYIGELGTVELELENIKDGIKKADKVVAKYIRLQNARISELEKALSNEGAAWMTERDQLLEKVEQLEKEKDKIYSELLELVKKDEERQ